ncbi:MAG TPA: right-handed parallel beta-helix repeat-containing protein, partial [Candidatus Glassbacteria bacterium]|nr:right-handed parallel beta-helix repeat-containing protein [Candidatus Glassbacteria bacterium]
MPAMNSRLFVSAAAIVFLLLLLPSGLTARTLYLSTTGDDSAPFADGSEFATLGRAVDSLVAGDTLIVRDGVHTGGVITPALAGTAQAPIVIRGESLGAIIDTSGNLDALRLDHSSHIIVERITFRHATRAGLGIINCNHITVLDCVMADNGRWGILTGFVDDARFEGNECYGSKAEHGIYHSNSGDRFIIRGNISHHNAANGIHLNGDPEILGGDGVLNYGIVERNIIFNNGAAGGAGINMTHVQDVIVRNNLIYNNNAGGFTFYQDAGTFDQGSKRALIMNNTVYFKSNDRRVVNIAATSEKVVLVNNILVASNNNEIFQVWSDYPETIISDYNVLWGADQDSLASISTNRNYSLEDWRRFRDNDRNSVYGDPFFTLIDAADFTPADSSPALDAGAPLDTVKALVGRLEGMEWILAQLDSLPQEDLKA